MGMSPISSRNSVPPSAKRNLPSRPLRSAPVNAPGAKPKNSASNKVSGTAAILTLMKGPTERLDAAWMAWANNSLPVPVSPSSSTGLVDCAARRAWRFTSTAAGLRPIKLAKVYLLCRCLPVFRRWVASSRRASSKSRCSNANFSIRGWSVVSGWSNSTMPSAPITCPAPSRSGIRLTTKVPARLVSKSMRMGLPVSKTWCIWVFCTTLDTGWPTKSSSRSKPSAGKNRLYCSLIQTTRAWRSTSIMPSLALANSSNIDRAASSRILAASRGKESGRVMAAC